VSNVVNIVMVGDEAVGKSSIINCYAFDTFSDKYVPSAFDQFKCDIQIYNREYQQSFPTIKLNIQDLSGKPEYIKMR